MNIYHIDYLKQRLAAAAPGELYCPNCLQYSPVSDFEGSETGSRYWACVKCRSNDGEDRRRTALKNIEDYVI